MSLVPTDQPRDLALPGALTESQIDTLRRTIAHDLTNDELDLFAAVCRRTGLDPFAKQIYAIKRTTRRKVRGNWVEEDVLTIQTGIDGYRVIAERSQLYGGQDPPEWCGPDGVWTDVWLFDKPPKAARVAVYRKDVTRPFVGVAKFDSYADRWPAKDGQALGDLRNLWKTMPEGQIAKCAEALALRKAFPNDLSGIYTTEEMEQANAPIDVHGGERRGIPAEQFREIVAAAEALSPGQIAELQAWRDAEGLVIKPQDLTQDDARRVMEKILDLGRGGGGGDEPVSGSAAAPPPPVLSGGGDTALSPPPAGGGASPGVSPGEGTPEGVPSNGVVPPAVAPSPGPTVSGGETDADGTAAVDAPQTAHEAAPSGPDTPTAAVLLAATGKTAGSAVVALKRAASEVDPDGPFMADEIEAVPEFAARVLAHLGGMPLDGDPKSTFTKKQNGWIHAVWANHGGDNARKAYLSQLTSGRTDSSGELTAAEKKAYLAKTEEMA